MLSRLITWTNIRQLAWPGGFYVQEFPLGTRDSTIKWAQQRNSALIAIVVVEVVVLTVGLGNLKHFNSSFFVFLSLFVWTLT